MLLAIVFLLGPFARIAVGRTYTNTEGKKIEADFISATETHVTLRLTKNGKMYTLPLEKLSAADCDYIEEQVEAKEEEAEALGEELARAEAIANVVKFVENNKGKKVGDGECWTLADEAYKAARVNRPSGDIRVWGRVVEWEDEDLKPGDIVEFESANFGNFRTAEFHTAVITKPGRRKGSFEVHHQNWGADKNVTIFEFNLKELTEGKVIVYRYDD